MHDDDGSHAQEGAHPGRLLLLLIGILLCGRGASAQVDSTLGFFPLAIGDVWQYHEFYRNPCDPLPISKFITVRVVGDTLMPDGRTYKRIDGMAAFLGGSFLRMDTSTACLYHYQSYPIPSQALQDSFLALPGDQVSSYPCSKTCMSLDSATVLGVQVATKTFRGGCVYELPNTTYARGIGLIRESENAGEGSGCPIGWVVTRELVYACVSGREYGEIVGVARTGVGGPKEVALDQNFPNPFNPVTTIAYSLNTKVPVSLCLFNTLGQQVRVLFRGEQDAGHHQVRFDGSGLPSGAYYCRLQGGGVVQTKILILAK